MKKAIIITTILIFFLANFLNAQRLVIIDATTNDTKEIFNNVNYDIHFYNNKIIIATENADQGFSSQILDLSPWKKGEAYFLLHKPQNNKKNYEVELLKNATILSETKDFYIVKTIGGNDLKLEPAVDNGIVHISKTRARLPKSNIGFSGKIEADTTVENLKAMVDTTNLQATISHLQSYGTRDCYSAEAIQAQNWLQTQLSNYGYLVAVMDFPAGSGSSSDNLIAVLPGSVYPEKYIAVGAHYDSRSISGMAPGADDNASGTAAVLEMARILSDQTFEKSIIFCLFSGEEYGLYGSAAYAAQAASQNLNILGYFNMDMIGYLLPGSYYHTDIIAPSQADSLKSFYTQTAGLYLPDFTVETGILMGGDSDHTSFNNNGYMGIFPFEDVNYYSPYIHTAADTIGPSVNNFQYAQLMTQATLVSIATMAVPHYSSIGIDNDDSNKEIVNSVIIYPNPASNYSYFEIPAGIEYDKIELYNHLGALIDVLYIENGTSIVEYKTENLPNGVYLVRLINGQASIEGKLTISR